MSDAFASTIVALAQLQDLHARDDVACARKARFQRDGEEFLRRVARDLGVKPGRYDIQVLSLTDAESGQVILQCAKWQVMLAEFVPRQGVAIRYRRCHSRHDPDGGINHWLTMRQLVHQGYSSFITRCLALPAPPSAPPAALTLALNTH